jgi:uncharacterized radical SAM superfamily Fe-S cluster-containing enzyme
VNNVQGKKILSNTESLCPHCLQRIPAARVEWGDDIYLEKTCPEHGYFLVPVWRGQQPSYKSWVKPRKRVETAAISGGQGCPFECGHCQEHRQSICSVLLEVTNRCNLDCPVCFASAGEEEVPDPDLETIKGWYQRLLASGGPYNIQLSGGEPTLRDDLPEIIALGRSLGFSFFQLNTNGLRLSREPEFLGALKQAGLSTVFLQFDGTRRDIYLQLRGRDILAEKLEVIKLCGEAGVGVVLVPTVVPGVNDQNLGEIIQLAVENIPVVRGVHFQPISYIGRYPFQPTEQQRITIPEVMRRIVQQTAEKIKMVDFRPSSIWDGLCAFHANYVLMPDGELLPTTKHDEKSYLENCCDGSCRDDIWGEPKQVSKFIASRWSAPKPSAQMQKSCCNQKVEKDSLDLFLERMKNYTFCISGMAFQDVWNLELERLRYCSVHVVTPDGKFIPFCAYNLTNSEGVPLHRGR